jgi:hypothetical protein
MIDRLGCSRYSRVAQELRGRGGSPKEKKKDWRIDPVEFFQTKQGLSAKLLEVEFVNASPYRMFTMPELPAIEDEGAIP